MANEKLLPRNQTARLARTRAAGNPVLTELESGVGNCFPGLELDLRNLERRFFPFLVVDFIDSSIEVVAVDIEGARAALQPGAVLSAYETLAAEFAQTLWTVQVIDGDFAGFGKQAYTVSTLISTEPRPDRPLDPWTAVRLLLPGSSVILTLRRERAPERELELIGRRSSYLNDDGAFAEAFQPGELTQSLCSPWTHDFRDCGCYYWASNHPDIVLPAVPPGASNGDPRWGPSTAWLRRDRDTSQGVPPDAYAADEMAYFEINERWQELDIILDGREERGPYAPGSIIAAPLPAAGLVQALRYAAGVELAVTLEYLAAVYSINPNAGANRSVLRGDARAARAELLRVAISEMRHLRQVNGILFAIHRASGAAAPFEPALGIATLLPKGDGIPAEPIQFRPLTSDVIADFVRIEAPSLTVDGLYGQVLSTLENAQMAPEMAIIRSIMADGAEHYATFRAIQEWLDRHPGAPYLRQLSVPAVGDPALQPLQAVYVSLLKELHAGYAAGLPNGAGDIGSARARMLGPNGIDGVCEALARGGRLPVFGPVDDPLFAPVAPP